MTIEYLDNLKEKSSELLAPVQKLNKLNASKLEKLLALQTTSLQVYSDFGVTRLKAALEVSNAEELVKYLNGQVEFAKKLSEQAISDAKAAAEFSKKYSAEVQKIAEENISALTPKAA